jgi:pyrimidine-nucleoside phosphorylase
MIDIGAEHGCPVVALLTAMDRPLGRACGNALEVRESLEILRGDGPADLRALTLELAARMLVTSGAEPAMDGALSRALRALDSGAALERFTDMVEAQGGDPRAFERRDGLAVAPVVSVVAAPRAGMLQAVDTFGLGELLVAIGAGRAAKENAIDPAVGLVMHARIGDTLRAGSPLVELHLAGPDPGAVARVQACFTIGDGPAETPALVIERLN